MLNGWKKIMGLHFLLKTGTLWARCFEGVGNVTLPLDGWVISVECCTFKPLNLHMLIP